MALTAPLLDDRSYEQLRDEVVRRIAVYSPEWTDSNQSDPGITLVELFAFLADTLLWLIDERQRQRRRRRARRLACLVVGATGLGLVIWRTSRTAGLSRNKPTQPCKSARQDDDATN
jgi:hypothetical protein